MRIVGGRFRSRLIKAPPGDNTRPTTDRVRESVFSMINARMKLDAAVVLDLFAGSGALGLEALSRGAAGVTFIEQNRTALSVLKTNIDQLNVSDESVVLCRDAYRYLQDCSAVFDLVVADPPYGDSRVRDLPSLVRPLLNQHALFVLEHGPTVDFGSADGVILTREFGRTQITLFDALSSNS